MTTAFRIVTLVYRDGTEWFKRSLQYDFATEADAEKLANVVFPIKSDYMVVGVVVPQVVIKEAK